MIRFAPGEETAGSAPMVSPGMAGAAATGIGTLDAISGWTGTAGKIGDPGQSRSGWWWRWWQEGCATLFAGAEQGPARRVAAAAQVAVAASPAAVGDSVDRALRWCPSTSSAVVALDGCKLTTGKGGDGGKGGDAQPGGVGGDAGKGGSGHASQSPIGLRRGKWRGSAATVAREAAHRVVTHSPSLTRAQANDRQEHTHAGTAQGQPGWVERSAAPWVRAAIPAWPPRMEP